MTDLEVPFVFDVTCEREVTARSHHRAADRRPFAIALIVSLLLHGALVGAAAIVAGWHIHRAPVARTLSGDQGGDASAIYQSGNFSEIPVEPVLPPPIDVTMAETDEPSLDPSAIDAPESTAIASAALPLDTPMPANDRSPFGVTGGSGFGVPRASAPRAPVMNPPRVARGNGLGDSSGIRGDREGVDGRGLPIPEYPIESRRHGEEGEVQLDVEVLITGEVGAIRVATSSGYPRLDDAAVAAAREATFEPATRDGQATVAHLTIPYRFVLRQAMR